MSVEPRVASAGAIELFCCSGGMSEGFRRAGLGFDLYFDVDADACDSHEKNLGARPIQLDVRDLLRMARAGWILQGFPPCWSFLGRTKAARWAQIGMAMPPALAAAVARSVRAQLEATEGRAAA